MTAQVAIYLICTMWKLMEEWAKLCWIYCMAVVDNTKNLWWWGLLLILHIINSDNTGVLYSECSKNNIRSYNFCLWYLQMTFLLIPQNHDSVWSSRLCILWKSIKLIMHSWLLLYPLAISQCLSYYWINFNTFMQVVARANEWEDVDNVTERIKLLAMLTVLKSWYPKLISQGPDCHSISYDL